MDSLLGYDFPVFDNHLLFQSRGGDSYDFPIFADLLQEQMFDVVGWECASNSVDANPNENLPVEAIHGSGADRADTMKPKRDRSKTILSERKRRGRMKEKLYELRSMVPNITKMDKASIIADAIVYLQELQGQEKKLAEEIRNLEGSSASNSACNLPTAMKAKGEKSISLKGKILGVTAHQVGEKRFQVKIVCSREDGASSSLYNAVHSLDGFKLESSVIARTSDQYICTLTFDCGGMWEEMNAGTMEYWVMDCLLRVGFPFITNSTSSI